MGQLINTTLPNIVQGVSLQFDENRRDSQVKEMDNCALSLAKGIYRRNPLKTLDNSVLKDSKGNNILPNDYYSYSYERGTDLNELYIILLGNKKWHIFDSNGNLISDYLDDDNAGADLNYLDCTNEFGIIKPASEVFELMTIGDYTFLLNKLVITKMKSNIDGIENEHLRTAVYWIKQTGLVATATNASGTVTFEGHKFNLRLNNTLGGAQANTTIKTADLVAEQIQLAMNGGPIDDNGNLIKTDGPYYTSDTYWTGPIEIAYADGSYAWRIEVKWEGKILYDKTFSTYNDANDVTEFIVGDYTYSKDAYATGKYYSVKRNLLIEVDIVAGNWKRTGSMIYNTVAGISDRFEWFDSFGNTASFGFKGEVSKIEDLPENVPASLNELLVKVGNGKDTSYWLKWNGSAWNESRAGGLQNNIDETTMPHTFIRSDNGKFSFGYYGKYDGTTNDLGQFNIIGSSNWSSRKVGDLTTAPNPSFIGKTISNMFSHNNRLGLLTGSNIVLSETAKYGNFFPTTLRTIPDNDPIDVAVATKEVTGLLRALSVNSNLILFSKSSQFTLFGNGGVLSPNNAEIIQLSNYKYNDIAKAVEYKNIILFTSQSGDGTDVLGFNSNGTREPITAETLNLQIPNYIDKDVHKIVTHSNSNYVFFFSKNKPNEIVVFNFAISNGQEIQNAFHKWKFNIDILDINIIDDELFIISKDIDKMYLNSISLAIPKDYTTVEYIDKYEDNTQLSYISELEFGKFYIKNQNGLGNRRGRIQVRTLLYTIDEYSNYKTIITNINVLRKRNFDNFVLDSNNKWNDDGKWCDYQNSDLTENCAGTTPTVWFDLNNFNVREYTNDEKVTVMGNNEQIQIKFRNNTDNPSKGFELSTVNYEILYNSRSTRR